MAERGPTRQVDQVDLSDPQSFVNGVPFAVFDHLRRTEPVAWQDEAGGPGFWSVTRHADVIAVDRDARRFSSALRGAQSVELSEAALAEQRLMLPNMDPPHHTRYRRLVSGGLTARALRGVEATISKMAEQVIDGVCERGTCDVVQDVAAELPLQVICQLLGVPTEDRHQILSWSTRLMAFDDPTYNAAPDDPEEAAAELYAYFSELAAARRRKGQDDLVTQLIGAEVGGERLSDMELDLFFLLLTVAGNETTRTAIAQGTLALIEHPAERARLQADPALLESAVEEILRWTTPILQFRRTATVDAVVGGQPIAANDKVLIWYVSANRDEVVFTDPYRFDVGRSPNDHVAFGRGPHTCLGGHLARLQLRAIVSEMVVRMPDAELAAPVTRLRSNVLHGLVRAPLRFTPSPPTS